LAALAHPLEAIESRRTMLRFAPSLPLRSSERNQWRQIAASLRTLFNDKKWLDANTVEGSRWNSPSTARRLKWSSSLSRKLWNVPATRRLSVQQGAPMKFTWKQLFGLSVAMLLFGTGVWANVVDGTLYQNKGAWVSHAVK
jgi:hypothetical protein